MLMSDRIPVTSGQRAGIGAIGKGQDGNTSFFSKRIDEKLPSKNTRGWNREIQNHPKTVHKEMTSLFKSLSKDKLHIEKNPDLRKRITLARAEEIATALPDSVPVQEAWVKMLEARLEEAKRALSRLKLTRK